MIKAVMQFHFWGEYSAKISLMSDSLLELTALKTVLDFKASCPTFDACGRRHEAEGWRKIVEVDLDGKTIYGFQGWFAKEDLEKAVAQIKEMPGGEKIDSMAKSIDSGPLCILQV